MTKQLVATPSVFSIDESFDDARFMRVRIAVMHSGENLNGSSFSTDVIKDAEDSFKNIPVLANVIQHEDGTIDYGGHDMHLEEDLFNSDSLRVVYDEKIVGIVPETNNFEIVHDDDRDIDFAYVDAYLYREYGNYAADILESRGGQTSVSAEIYVDDVSVNAQTKVLEVGKMTMSGVTLLGEDVNPAMKGANASTFSSDESDVQAQMIEVMKELKQSLDNYTATFSVQENLKEGGAKDMGDNTELLEQTEEVVDEEEVIVDNADVSEEENFDESDPENEDADEPEEPEPEVVENAVNFTAEYNGKTVQMSVSLQDKIAALSELINETYEDDGTWYEVEVYDDEKYVVMIDWWRGKGYKQSYKVRKDSYSLVGDRVEVFCQWLTQDEINKLDDMRQNYSAMSELLSKYEDEPKKVEILSSDEYSSVAGSDEFVELMNDHFDMSIEDVTKRADEILLNAAKSHKFSTGEDAPAIKPIPARTRKTKRYGSLFDGIVK